MATFKIVVQQNQRRDGLYPVTIRVIWKRQSTYIKTEYYVSTKQITKDFKLTDNSILRELLNRIAEYEEIKVKKLGKQIYQYTAKELAEYFKTHSNQVQNSLDFIKFANEVIEKTINKGTAGIYQTVINSLNRYTGREKLYFEEISFKFLMKYELWLKEENLTVSGINLYMRTFKALFRKARDLYNDEDRGDIQIPNYPFKKYKIPVVPETEKRALTIEQIRKIRDLDLKLKRDIQARDVFMLSFYLIGINTVDLYNASQIKGDRLIYYRTKTKSRRLDQALLSIKVEPEAKELVEKYTDGARKRLFNFHLHYFEHKAFNKAVNIGLKNIGKRDEIKLPGLQFYSARHSWATIARNDCHISKSDIDEALGHTSSHKITDIYIRKDYTIIDKANRQVLNLLQG